MVFHTIIHGKAGWEEQTVKVLTEYRTDLAIRLLDAMDPSRNAAQILEEIRDSLKKDSS